MSVGSGEQQRARTRQQLTGAARELIAARGIAGIRIAELTDRAGVGRGSFYNHFSSRDALVDAVVREAVEGLAGSIVAGLDPDADPARQAAIADRRFVRVAYEDPDTARLFVNLAHGETLFEHAARPYARIPVDRGIVAGRFSVPDVEMALTVLTSSALAVMRTILAGRAQPGADAAHATAMLVLLGVPAGEAVALGREALP